MKRQPSTHCSTRSTANGLVQEDGERSVLASIRSGIRNGKRGHGPYRKPVREQTGALPTCK